MVSLQLRASVAPTEAYKHFAFAPGFKLVSKEVVMRAVVFVWTRFEEVICPSLFFAMPIWFNVAKQTNVRVLSVYQFVSACTLCKREHPQTKARQQWLWAWCKILLHCVTEPLGSNSFQPYPVHMRLAQGPTIEFNTMSSSFLKLRCSSGPWSIWTMASLFNCSPSFPNSVLFPDFSNLEFSKDLSVRLVISPGCLPALSSFR